jgi:hypothetical protein
VPRPHAGALLSMLTGSRMLVPVEDLTGRPGVKELVWNRSFSWLEQSLEESR